MTTKVSSVLTTALIIWVVLLAGALAVLVLFATWKVLAQ